MSTPSNIYRFQVDMLDETPRHGSHLRIKPQHGYAFWIRSSALPRRLRKTLLRIGADFTLTGNVMQKFNGSCCGPNQNQFLKLVGKHYVDLQAA